MHICDALEKSVDCNEDQKNRAKQVRIEVTKTLALRESSGAARNWLKTSILEAEGKIDYNKNATKIEPPLKPTELTRWLAVKLNPDSAEGLKYRIKIEFDDEPHKIDFQLKNCTLSDSVRIINSENYICPEGMEQVSVKTSWKKLRDAFKEGKNITNALDEVTPDIKTFTKIMDCFE